MDTVWSENKDTFYLNGLKQKGIEWESLSSINMPIGLSLPHDKNYLRFHFGNYLSQYAVDCQYQYILDGVDKKWSALTDLPASENYNNISPGHYTFRVSVKKGNGNWSTPSEFHFRIRPPWWFLLVGRINLFCNFYRFVASLGQVPVYTSFKRKRLAGTKSCRTHRGAQSVTGKSSTDAGTINTGRKNGFPGRTDCRYSP
ncbi:MAG: triple tyrosine motif-containing protein [Puia sp.]